MTDTSGHCAGDTVHVVVCAGKPVYASDDLENCRTVAGKLTAGQGDDTEVWKDVTCNIDTDMEQSEDRHE